MTRRLSVRHHAVRRVALVSAAASLMLFAAGCRQDMHNQPKFIPQRGTTFYADGRSSRPQVEDTVARGQLHEDAYFYTGMAGGKEGDMLPFPVTMQVLERGQERYNLYCTPCHSRVGNGNGMIVQRGYKQAGNFHDAKRLAEPVGHYFNVISHGYGAMPDYSAQITVADRWAITAYIRALQLSQAAKTSDVPAGAKIQQMSDIAVSEGLPASFEDEWTLPATAVSDSETLVPGGAKAAQPTKVPATRPAPAPVAKTGTTSQPAAN